MISLVIGGLMAFFIREIYQRFSRSVSNRESFSAVFIPLTVTTVLVIAVIKSSLALSLGLVGALSVVRFRAAIKDPEELVYLFFCIAVGLTLGAERWLEAFVGVLVFTFFVVTLHFLKFGKKNRHHSLILTITGDKEAIYGESPERFHALLDEVVGSYQVQRLECEDGHVQFRATVTPENEKEISHIMIELQGKLPGCSISYVNLHNLL